MSNIGRIKDLASKLFLTNIAKGNITLTEYSDDNLLFLELILEKELDIRRINKIRYLKSKSGLSQDDYKYTLDSYNIQFTKNVTKWHIGKLKTTNFIKDKTNVIIIGSSGVGKTHLAIGTVLNAIEQEIKSYYTTVTDLIKLLDTKDDSNKNKQKMEYIKSCDFVVIDEFGYIPLTQSDVVNLYNLINMINNYASIMIITNREFVTWKDIFYDEVLASTIIDRLIGNSFFIKIDAESYRLKKHQEENNTNANALVMDESTNKVD